MPLRVAGLPRALERVLRLCLVLIGAWLLLSALAWLAVPPILKWQAETRATTLLGRNVSVGAVDFNPWRLDVSFTALTVDAAAVPTPRPSGTPAPAPLLTIGTVHVDVSASSFLEFAPVLEAIDISDVHINITRIAPGRYDIDDVLQRLSRPSEAPSPAGPPTRFALHDLQIRDAALRFDDRPASRVHAVTGFDLSLPFLSDLPGQLDVKVTPRLSFRLNGVSFRSDGVGTPFAATRAGELRLVVQALDLVPYAAYLPASMPFRIAAGALSADLSLGFAAPPTGQRTLVVRGSTALNDARLLDAAGAVIASWRQLAVEIRSAEPLARRIALSSVRLDGAGVRLHRDADGRLAGPVTANDEPSPRAAAPDAHPEPWTVDLDRLDISDGALDWSDAAVRPAAALRLERVRAQARALHWPLRGPIAFSADASLAVQATAGSRTPALAIRGSASPTTTALKVTATDVPLNAFAGYWAQWIIPEVGGTASIDASVDWPATDQPGVAPRIAIASAVFDAPTLRFASTASSAAAVPFSTRRLALADARIDPVSRKLTIAGVSVDEPALVVERIGNGQLDMSGWWVPPATPAPASPAWRIEVGRTRLDGGRIQWTDRAVGRPGGPVRLTMADLHVAVDALQWEGSRPTVPAHFEARGRIGAPPAGGEPDARIPGTFDWRGVVGVAPLEIIGRLKGERLPLHLVVPYAGPRQPVRLAHLELGIDGQLSVRRRPTGVDVDAGADLLFGAVRIDSAPDARTNEPVETLLSWNTLAMKGVRLAVKPGERTKIDIDQATLADFVTRLAITETGRLNLRQVATGPDRPPTPGVTPAVAAGSAPASSIASQSLSLGGSPAETTAGTAARPARAAAPTTTLPPLSAASAAPSAAAGMPIDVRVNETLLTNGRIDFSDHFVRPNYSAALTGLNGRLGTVDSANPAMASLRLRGQAAGTAQLEIDGAVNPLARVPTLDLRAKATDLELAPLSPYAGKYAGYAIERGKLSMEVAYKLGADGRLDATNRVVLNQLNFGDRIASPTATSLPVLLAVSLLKDRNGVIDLDLPISGSLEDPQFSVAALIGRVLRNLLLKAVTSPFSLVARGVGGGETTDPGRVEFVPGTTRLTETGTLAVATAAKALDSKPALLLTVTGSADASREQDAYRTALLEERLLAERRTETVAAATAASAPSLPLSGPERERLVRRLYRDSDLPDKPRNVFGLQTDVPLAEMERRLKADVSLTPDAARGLALQRGVTVRDALIASGLPSERLFLAAPKVDAAVDAPDWRPEAQLALTLR